jgi:tetratricopeptide (TPR) repeat protein
MSIIDLNELGAIIDRACDNFDEQELNLIILTLKDYVKTLNDSQIKAYIYYLLSNAQGSIQNIKCNQQERVWQYEQVELFNQIFYLRKSIKEKGFNSLELGLQISILTNLGNAFSNYGRTINALKYYNKALSLYPNYFMSLTNKAICLETYSRLLYDYSHCDLFLRQSYFDFNKANEEIISYLENHNHDYEYYNNIKNSNEIHIEKIENYLTKDWLNCKLSMQVVALYCD